MASTWIITTRNPRTKLLTIISGNTEPGTEIAEFPTEEAARECADSMKLCNAWGYELIEVAL